MSIATAVVDQVERAEAPPGAGRVESVHLEVGQLAGVVADSLQFCFELVCAGTALDGAELRTETVPARARCADCATAWDTGSPPDLCCPGCGGGRTELLSGRELRIRGVRWADAPVHADQEG